MGFLLIAQSRRFALRQPATWRASSQPERKVLEITTVKLSYKQEEPMSQSEKVVYTSRVRIERERRPMRRAYLPAEAEPVIFGVHSEVAAHYKVSPEAFPPRATTLDYVVAGAGG